MKVKASVRLHNDQTIRTRNFTAGSEIVERGATFRVANGKEPTLRGNWRLLTVAAKQKMCQWTHVVSAMTRYLETCRRVKREKASRLLQYPT